MSSAGKANLQQRVFSENSHHMGKWQTKTSSTQNPLLRYIWNFCSFKRKGIDTLAAQYKNSQFILDLGAGNGAYSHWFLGRRPDAKLIAVDWSFAAAQKIVKPEKGSICRVCADIHYLPFKPESFDTIFSIDTFGHVSHLETVLDETFRVAKNGIRLFLHSECCDYQHRWPDKVLIQKNKKDILAEYDGHFSLKPSTSIYSLYNQRFFITSFFSPAGILGWLIGYPEKYDIGFTQANLYFFSGITALFATIKRTPLLGAVLRFCNALTNHIELFLGLHGGGSCFAFLEKPSHNITEKT